MKIISKRISKKDMQSALETYNYYIDNSFANFEEKKLSIRIFTALYNKLKSENLPFLIAKKNSEVVGIAFVNKFRNKSGYKHTFEHSIYVSPKYISQGLGSKILKELIRQCKNNNNIKNLIAVIGGSDNKSSIKIHKKNGFNYIGTIKKIGYKKNKWIDSVYMQKKI